MISAPPTPAEAQANRSAQTDHISVIIPAFNEGDMIAETIQHVHAMAEKVGLDVEVVVIDDGSVDETGAKAANEGARMLRHPHNVGYGRSLKDGISIARNETIVITDADGTYPIDTIPKLLAQYARGFDMVVAARTGDVYHGPFLKKALRWVLKFLVEFTAGRRIPDVNSGLRVFSRSTGMTYFSHLCDGFSFTTSMTLAYMMTGKFVTYLDVPYNQRVGQTKVRLFRDALRTLQFIVEAIVYYNPIKIFILISFICLILMIATLGTGFGFRLVGLVVVGAGLGVSVVLAFCLGLIAVLLKQIMDTARRSSSD